MSPSWGSEGLWCAVKDPADKIEASWVDGSVIYDMVDGKFTALNVTSTVVLYNLRDAGCATPEVLGERLFGEKVSPEETAQLVQILKQLQNLGLVRSEAA